MKLCKLDIAITFAFADNTLLLLLLLLCKEDTESIFAASDQSDRLNLIVIEFVAKRKKKKERERE